MRSRCVILAALALAPLAAACADEAATRHSGGPAARPNILFVLGDDLASRVLGCYGGTLARTPVVDRLARQGAVFEHSFVTTSICAASRACILAGQHQRTTGIKDFDRAFTPESLAQTYPLLLKNAGYRVGFVGKWGVGAAPAQMHLPASQFDYWRGWPGQAGYWYADDVLLLEHGNADERPTPTARHEADQVPEYLREFIAGGRADQPWCLSVSLKSVHPPRAPHPSLRERFRGADLPSLPETCSRAAFDALPAHVRQTASGCDAASGRPLLDQWGVDGFREQYARYLRSVETFDLTIGQLLDVLHRSGADGNTVIIICGDNGHFAGEKGLKGKWLMYEESIRVPTIFYDPRRPEHARGRRLQPMVLSIDLAPTMLELAGVATPPAMQGESWLRLLDDPAGPWRTDWFYEHTYTQPPGTRIAKSEGVRTARWKYIRWLDPKPHVEELFDLQADPRESRNLAGDPAHEDVLRDLRGRYQHWRRTLPDNAPDPDEYADAPAPR